MGRSRGRDATAFCLGIVLVGCMVQAAGAVKGDTLVFPGVGEIVAAFGRLLVSAKTWRLVATTLRHLVAAMAVSVAAGTALGLVSGASRFARQALKPALILLRSVPMIVLVVIVMVLSDYALVPVAAPSLLLVPLVAEATAEGFLGIDRELLDVYRLNGAFSPRVLFSVHIPLMAGYLRQAYINAVGMGMKLVVSSEYLVQTRDSLGKAVYSSGYFNEYQDIYAYALLMVLLVLFVSELPLWILRRAQKRPAA